MSSNKFDTLAERLEKPKPPSSDPNWKMIVGMVGAVVLIILILIAIGEGRGRVDSGEPTVVAAVTTSTPDDLVTAVENTPTPTTAPTNTPEPTPTETPTPEPTATDTPAPTATPTATSSPTATATPQISSPTPSPSLVILGGGTDQLNAALYTCQEANSQQLGTFVEIGEPIDELLGRSSNGNWVYVRHNGQEGWVSATPRYVTLQSGSIMADLEVLPESETICEERPVTINNTATPSISGTAIAYWNPSANTSPISNGRWKAEFTVRVPSGSTPTVIFEELTTTITKQRTENNYDFYLVSVSGMSCDGDFAKRMTVNQGGRTLTIRQEGTEQNNPNIFIAKPLNC
jgi:hypothetical protein